MRHKRKPPTSHEISGALVIRGFRSFRGSLRNPGFLSLYGSLCRRGFLPKAGSLPRDGAAVLAPQGGSR